MTLYLKAGGAAVALWLLLRGKKAAPAATPAPKPKGGAAELSNGNFARFVGPLEGPNTYIGCQDKDGNVLPDSACALVQVEWPEVEVPLTKLVQMTEGSRVL